MSRVSAALRRYKGGYLHWCPACVRAHCLPDGWTFNGDLGKPTFTPSFLHTMPRAAVTEVCHYILTDGTLYFQSDCTHGMAGQSVALPDLPNELFEG